jgi:hypothetical protein
MGMVAFPLLATGRAGGNEPHDSGAISVGDGDNQQVGNESGGVFPNFGGMAGIHEREPPGIGKHQSCLRKADSVLGEIRGRFIGIPLKIHGFENVHSFSNKASKVETNGECSSAPGVDRRGPYHNT